MKINRSEEDKMKDIIYRKDAIVALNEGIRNPKNEWTLDRNMFAISNNRTIALAVERINALPTADRPINDDLIQRSDAIEAVQEIDTRETVSVSEAVNAIKALPSCHVCIKCDKPIEEWTEKTIIEIDQALALTKTLGGTYYDGVFNGLHMAREIIKKHCGAYMKGNTE